MVTPIATASGTLRTPRTAILAARVAPDLATPTTQILPARATRARSASRSRMPPASRTLPLAGAAAGERRPLAAPDAGRRPQPRRRLGASPRHRRDRSEGGCAVVVHGDNGVTIDGVPHAPGARERWLPGQKLVLGDGPAPPCRACSSSRRRREPDMSMPFSSAPRGLVTPIEPASARLRASVALPSSARETSYSIAFGRIDAAVASSCGSPHHRNEDAHSPAGASDAAVRRRRRRRRRGDGGDGEPRARRPAARRARRRAARRRRGAAGDARRRPGDRQPHRRGDQRAGRGDGRDGRAGQRARVALADRLGRRLPRVPPVEPRRAALRAADPRRHLPPAERDAARRRLARRPGADGRQRRDDRRQCRGARPRLGRAARPLQRRRAQARHAVRVAAGADPAGAAGAPLRRPDRAASANGSTDDATVLLVQRTGFASARPHWLPPFPGDAAPGSER